jgi:hypothetical protein
MTRPIGVRLSLIAGMLGCGAGVDHKDPVVDLIAVNDEIRTVAQRNPGVASTTRLTAEEYGQIARDMMTVPGVSSAQYAGDPLGTIHLEVGGGVLVWRHLSDDFHQDLDVSSLVDPKNHDWLPPPAVTAPAAAAAAAPPHDSNAFADRFPRAQLNPDPDFHADDPVPCPAEGKIAIVDFVRRSADATTVLYDKEFVVDNVLLWERIKLIGAAARFEVKEFDEDELNLGNLSKLADYTIVITNGHGNDPYKSSLVDKVVVPLFTPELYGADKKLENGMTYGQAFKLGYIWAWTSPDEPQSVPKVAWSPLLLANAYHPTTTQLWMVNECFGMIPERPAGRSLWDPSTWSGAKMEPVYNFGNGLQDAGVAQVFGYIGTANPTAIVDNLMSFFRRMFGGLSNRDLPPARFYPPGLSPYWPLCIAS